MQLYAPIIPKRFLLLLLRSSSRLSMSERTAKSIAIKKTTANKIPHQKDPPKKTLPPKPKPI